MGRSLGSMMQSVQRALGDADVPLNDIARALDQANQEVHGKYEWPWAYGTWNLLVPPIYQVGTVSVASGSATVTGTGTAWDTTWIGRRIQFGSDNVARIVASVDSPTQLTLEQVANLSASLVDVKYTLYQAVFEFPADFMVGQDLVMVQPTLRCQITHRGRAFVEVQNMFLNQLYTSLAMFYCDYGISAAGLQQILLAPPCTGPSTFPMVYRRRPPPLADVAQLTWLDSGYSRMLEFFARGELKPTYRIPGAEEDTARASSLLLDMRRRVGTAAIDTTTRAGWFGNSSINDGGLFIGPWMGS